ncbi:MAG: 30S ribosomal protein S16 [Proteobacteria bacterium]|nr:30S ribosomal protein S16 [Pseudomonadota bacterium]
MAVKIRLFRAGSKKKPFYRIVVSDSTSPRDGKFIEVLGYYDPAKGIENANLKKELYEAWITKGAEPTQTVKNIVKSLTK